MNRVCLTGRITRDLELKKTSNDKSVCSFDVAVNRGFGNDNTDFVSCVSWDNQAENLVKYQRKGSKIAVEGSLRVDKYQDSDGKNRYKIYVQASNIEYLDSKKEEPEKPKENVFDDDLPF